MGTEELLSSDATVEYWDLRHGRYDDLLSGGDLSYDRAGNAAFYAVRLGRLLDLVGTPTSPSAAVFVLDAGCGKGWFSRSLGAAGFRVTGIDASAEAIASCRRADPAGHYVHSAVASWSARWAYDLVLSVDVLFHILDDGEWERSLRTLTAHVALTGRLIVSDWGEDVDSSFGDYMRARATSRYADVLSSGGMRYLGWHSNRFRANPMGFHVATRVG